MLTTVLSGAFKRMPPRVACPGICVAAHALARRDPCLGSIRRCVLMQIENVSRGMPDVDCALSTAHNNDDVRKEEAICMICPSVAVSVHVSLGVQQDWCLEGMHR